MAVITASNPSIQMLVSLLFHLELEGFVFLASWVVHSKNKAEQVADTPNFFFLFLLLLFSNSILQHSTGGIVYRDVSSTHQKYLIPV